MDFELHEPEDVAGGFKHVLFRINLRVLINPYIWFAHIIAAVTHTFRVQITVSTLEPTIKRAVSTFNPSWRSCINSTHIIAIL